MEKVLTHIRGIPIYERKITVLPYNGFLKSRARALRKAGNLAEVLFWMQVHKKKFHTIDFDRQRVIGSFIVDFYVRGLGLVIEIDGGSHIGKEDYDARREEYLRDLDLEIYRITDLQVKHDLSNVMRELEDFIIKRYGRGT